MADIIFPTCFVGNVLAEKISTRTSSVPAMLWRKAPEVKPESKAGVSARVLIIGEAGVGKSSLLMRFSRDRYYEQGPSTIGVEFASHSVDASQAQSQREVKLQVFDVAGQERFRAVARNYYRGLGGALLVFDLTDRHSFESLEFWLHELECYGGVGERSSGALINSPLGPPVVLLGNKIDVGRPRISQEEIAAFTKRHQIPAYFAVSAKTGENVSQAFAELAKLIAQRIERAEELGLDIARHLQGLRLAERDAETVQLDADTVQLDPEAQGCCY